MSVQDGLLSFQIKETIFLSSDKAEIGEIKELELLPDVEIIESAQEISIAGCLLVNGVYEPAGEAQADAEGGADPLVSAMSFTPFHLDQKQPSHSLYGTEQHLSHRIPLNISIPLSRIAELGDIYAIVDGFDYELKSPRQLRIQADLKISGIRLDEFPKGPQATAEEEWEFVHVANQEDRTDAQPVSLDEIERKLNQLEKEIEAQEQRDSVYPPAPYLSQNAFGTGAFQPPAYQSALHHDDEAGDSSVTPVAYQPKGGASSESAEAQASEATSQAPVSPPVSSADAAAASVSEPAAPETADLEARGNVIDFQSAYEERQAEQGRAEAKSREGEWTEDGAEQEEAEASAGAEETEETAAVAANEEKEVRVAISAKSSQEQEETVNLRSLFTQAPRPRPEEPEAKESEVSQAASKAQRKAAETTVTSGEGAGTLTSFVRGEEQQFSRVKICIIQRDETLQTIAERYALPVSRLIEVNNLSSDRIVAGQVLYIPQ